MNAIHIVPYDPGWPSAFAAERDRIAAALGSVALRIDHNGSTSVTGLAAKPVIDIQISVRCLQPPEPYAAALTQLGYVHVPDPDDSFCVFFHQPRRWPHTHHVHVVQAGGGEERRTLAFRDYLREHPEAARAYEALKRGLALQHSATDFSSREAYADAKTAFVTDITDRALAKGILTASDLKTRRYHEQAHPARTRLPIAIRGDRRPKQVNEHGMVGESRSAARTRRGRGRSHSWRRAWDRGCPGRSWRDGHLHRPQHTNGAVRVQPAETIEETAEIVTHLGGTGIPAAVDHLEPSQVTQLADRIRKEHGRIDVLVNDIWGGELLKGPPPAWNRPIWQHNLEDGLRILRLAIDTHLITSHALLPLLVERPGGLLVEVTDGTADYNASHYRISVFYDLAKVAVNRLAFSLGHELAPHDGTAVSITPGWLRSEMMLENYGVSEGNWRDALRTTPDNERPAAPADFALSESPRYVGRAVVALATDPDRERWNQQSASSGQLASEYGFTDIDGSRPDIWRYIKEIREGGLNRSPDDYR